MIVYDSDQLAYSMIVCDSDQPTDFMIVHDSFLIPNYIFRKIFAFRVFMFIITGNIF